MGFTCGVCSLPAGKCLPWHGCWQGTDPTSTTRGHCRGIMSGVLCGSNTNMPTPVFWPSASCNFFPLKSCNPHPHNPATFRPHKSLLSIFRPFSSLSNTLSFNPAPAYHTLLSLNPALTPPLQAMRPPQPPWASPSTTSPHTPRWRRACWRRLMLCWGTSMNPGLTTSPSWWVV